MTEYDYATDIAVKQEKAYAEGISIGMERGLEQGLEQGRLEGLERGAYKKAVETAKAMFLDKIPVETISKYTSLPLETVLELVQTK